MIRVLVVDDLELIREGIKVLLKKSEGIEIIGTANDGLEAIEKIKILTPDLILLDIEMPLANGFDVCNQISIKFQQIKTIIISGHQEKEHIRKAIEVGAKGYLLKSTSTEELEQTIRLVDRGYSIFESQIIEQLVRSNLKSTAAKNTVFDTAIASTPRKSQKDKRAYVAFPPVAEMRNASARNETSRSGKAQQKLDRRSQNDILQIWIFSLAVLSVCLILLVVILLYS